MHYENDYIMRMIHLLRLLYEYLWGLTDAQQLSAGEDAIAEAMRRLTGLSLHTADSLPAGQLVAIIGEDTESAPRVYALAELMRLRAELHTRLGFPDEGREMDMRAFRIYLRLTELPRELTEGLYPLLREYKGRFFSELTDSEYVELSALFEAHGYYADAEDAIRAQEDAALSAAFYARLLRLPEDELSRGGLPRHEVVQGLEELS